MASRDRLAQFCNHISWCRKTVPVVCLHYMFWKPNQPINTAGDCTTLLNGNTACYLFTHTQPFNGPLSGTTRVGQYQKKHSPTHTHPDHQTSFINFLHLLRSTASPVFSLRAWQSFSTTSLQVLFGLVPSTSYSMHFFTHICMHSSGKN